MTESRVLLTPSDRATTAAPSLTDLQWRVLGVVGLLFTMVGGLDVLLTWVPPRFGSAEWEFGTISASLNGLPLPTLGLALLLARSLAVQDQTTARMVLALYAVMALFILAAGVLYALDAPIAFRAVENPVAREGLKKAVVKTAAQLTLYPAGLLWLTVRYWKRTGGAQ